uniref:Predicted protein n=1 Tax=Hordeum vulgare subsp. vulgare TaxID=112509 RepID=F2E936_HORVV|nr:predicted protein [Hordeum vulgare subsp. vulgare]
MVISWIETAVSHCNIPFSTFVSRLVFK